MACVGVVVGVVLLVVSGSEVIINLILGGFTFKVLIVGAVARTGNRFAGLLGHELLVRLLIAVRVTDVRQCENRLADVDDTRQLVVLRGRVVPAQRGLGMTTLRPRATSGCRLLQVPSSILKQVLGHILRSILVW